MSAGVPRERNCLTALSSSETAFEEITKPLASPGCTFPPTRLGERSQMCREFRGEVFTGLRSSRSIYAHDLFTARFFFGGLPRTPDRIMALSSILKIRPIAYLNWAKSIQYSA
jgi:hypothetical protein